MKTQLSFSKLTLIMPWLRIVLSLFLLLCVLVKDYKKYRMEKRVKKIKKKNLKKYWKKELNKED